MKGITNNHKSITQDYESLFYYMKDHCKKMFALNLRPIHSNSSVLVDSLLRL